MCKRGQSAELKSTDCIVMSGLFPECEDCVIFVKDVEASVRGAELILQCDLTHEDGTPVFTGFFGLPATCYWC